MEMVIATQNTMVSMNGMTVKRTQVIAERTGDVMMGAIKAQMIETLKAKLNNGIAHFIFVKKSGELREMWATTMSNIASAKTAKKTNTLINIIPDKGRPLHIPINVPTLINPDINSPGKVLK